MGKTHNKQHKIINTSRVAEIQPLNWTQCLECSTLKSQQTGEKVKRWFAFVCRLGPAVGEGSGGLDRFFVALGGLYLVLKMNPRLSSLLEPVRPDRVIHDCQNTKRTECINRPQFRPQLKLWNFMYLQYIVMSFFRCGHVTVWFSSGCWGASTHPRSCSNTAPGWDYFTLLANPHSALNSCGGGTGNNGSVGGLLFVILSAGMPCFCIC